jgi:hypothetical protein
MVYLVHKAGRTAGIATGTVEDPTSFNDFSGTGAGKMSKTNSAIRSLAAASAAVIMLTACGHQPAGATGSSAAASAASTSKTSSATASSSAAMAASSAAAQNTQESQSGLLSSSADEMQKTLDAIAAHPRFSGTDGEKTAADYIAGRFSDLGLTVTKQQVTANPYFNFPTFKGGTNVIAVRPASAPGGDIVIVSAHHDSMAGVNGADDDASGVTALIELARILKDVPSDTEIRFVSFTGEEEGRVGSRFYVNSLCDDEKQHIVGDIQLDMLGYYRGGENLLSTSDGKQTLLGNLLLGCPAVFDPVYRRDTLSDHYCFYNAGIPSVMISQEYMGYENHNTGDRARIVDTSLMETPVNAVASVLGQLMSDGASTQPASSGRTGIISTIARTDPVYIACERSMFDDMLGQDGVPAGETEDEVYGKASVYDYEIRWFGMADPVKTEALCVDDSVRCLRILAADAGYTSEEISGYLSAESADPAINMDSDGNILSYSWYEREMAKYFTLTPGKDDRHYTLTLENQVFGNDILHTYPMAKDDDAFLASVTDGRQKLIAQYALKIVPPEYRDRIVLMIYTDGVGNKLGMTYNDGDDNRKIDWGIDIADFFSSDGSCRDIDKSILTMVHEFGHALFCDSTQVDMTKAGDLPRIWYPDETYTKDAYARRFYDQFVKGTALDNAVDGQDYSVDYYFKHPDEFVDAYAGENAMKEDMAETFAVYVLTDLPDESDTSVAAEKLRFFADDPEMSSIREYIRNNLGLRK